MNKQEVLDKAKKENLFSDEAKNNKRRKGDTWGLIAANIVWIIFMITYYVKNKDIYHLLSLYFAYIGFSYLGKYSANKERSDLIAASGAILVCIGNLIIGLSAIWNF